MKKVFFAVVFFCTLFQSCKKTETDEQIVEEPRVETKEDLVADAQAKPLTSAALSTNAHDFGEVKKGESVEYVYEITNIGDNPLVISNVIPGCGCTASEYSQEPILPGKKGSVKLKFNSENFEGMQHKQAEVYANVDKSPIILIFTANVKP